MSEAKKEKWMGGYKRPGKKGPTYVIERWIDGTHWHVSTKCRTERAALKELEKFEADPPGYRSKRAAKTRTAVMSPELVADYLAHAESRKLDPGYIDRTEAYLTQMMVALGGRDLSRMSTIELGEALDAASKPEAPASKQARCIAIKAFCTYLRKRRGILTRANDPAMDLNERHFGSAAARRKKAMKLEVVEATIPHLPEDIADVAIVLAHTGMHIRELRRLHGGRGGIYEPVEWQKDDGVLLNVAVEHKRNLLKKDGDEHVMAFTDQAAVDALKRVLARKDFPGTGRIWYQISEANKKTGHEFHLGWLRHSVATWAAINRESDESVANQLGHADTKMVKRVYKNLGMAAVPLRLPRLRLVQGG